MYYSLISSMSKISDAEKFILAAGITDATQKLAINNLVNDLKSYGIWTKMKALYPFVGGTASSHKFNLKDPRDLDEAFRLTFSGGWTHSSNGALPNGTNAYANTFYTNISNNSSMWHYSRTNKLSGNEIEFGSISPNSIHHAIATYFSTYTYLYINILLDSTAIRYNSINTLGLFGANRKASNILDGWENGIKKGTNTDNIISVATSRSLTIGAYNAASVSYFSTKQTAFASIGDGLTDTEASNFYTSVQAYQTSLSRQV